MTNTFQDIINSEKPVLVDFYESVKTSDQNLVSVIKSVKKAMGSRIITLKIDIDKNKILADAYQISKTPTIVLFQKGKQLWRESGVLSKVEILCLILEKSYTI